MKYLEHVHTSIQTGPYSPMLMFMQLFVLDSVAKGTMQPCTDGGHNLRGIASGVDHPWLDHVRPLVIYS